MIRAATTALATAIAALTLFATPAFAQSASPAPTATAAPAVSGSTTPPDTGPSRTYAETFEKFIVGDFILSPRTYNEFSPGNSGGNGSYAVRGAIEFHLGNLPLMIAEDYRRFSYPHNTTSAVPVNCATNPNEQGCVTVINGGGRAFAPAFTANDSDSNTRLGIKLLDPRLYASVAYTSRSSNYGYPRLNGLGLGLEKLPDFEGPLGVHFGIWYYPSVTGNYSGPTAATNTQLSYRVLTYSIGATINFQNSPIFLDAGFAGDRLRAKTAPQSVNHYGPFLGLGFYTR